MQYREFEKLGINIVVKWNNRKLMSSLIKYIGITEDKIDLVIRNSDIYSYVAEFIIHKKKGGKSLPFIIGTQDAVKPEPRPAASSSAKVTVFVPSL